MRSQPAQIYKEFSESVRQGPKVAVRAFVRRGQALTARMEAFPKPIIAAVNGIAFGGGCEITEAVHLAVASESAVLLSRRSTSVSRQLSEERSGSRVSRDASGRLGISYTGIHSHHNGPTSWG